MKTECDICFKTYDEMDKGFHEFIKNGISLTCRECKIKKINITLKHISLNAASEKTTEVDAVL